MGLANEYIQIHEHGMAGCRIQPDLDNPPGFRLFNEKKIKGYLFNPTEIRINPPEAISRLIDYRAYDLGVSFCFNEKDIQREEQSVVTSSGKFTAQQIFIRTGASLELEGVLEKNYETDFIPCKLHMLIYVLRGNKFNFPVVLELIFRCFIILLSRCKNRSC